MTLNYCVGNCQSFLAYNETVGRQEVPFYVINEFSLCYQTHCHQSFPRIKTLKMAHLQPRASLC